MSEVPLFLMSEVPVVYVSVRVTSQNPPCPILAPRVDQQTDIPTRFRLAVAFDAHWGARDLPNSLSISFIWSSL